MFKDDMILAAEAEESSKPDHLGSFFATVVLALLACTWGAWLLTSFARLLQFDTPISWGYNLTAALFVAFLLADPIGSYLRRLPLKRVLARALAGLILGGSLQHLVVTPIAGGGVSMFVFLVMSLVILPMLVVLNSAERYLDSRGIVVSEHVGRGVLSVLQMPRAIPVALLVLIVFQLFWWIKPTPAETFVVIGAGWALTLLSSLWHFNAFPEDLDNNQKPAPGYGQFARVAATELFGFCKRHGPPVLYFTGIGWFAKSILPFVSIYYTVHDAISRLISLPIFADALIAIMTLAFGVGLALLSGRLVLWLAGRVMRWSTQGRLNRFESFRQALFLRAE